MKQVVTQMLVSMAIGLLFTMDVPGDTNAQEQAVDKPHLEHLCEKYTWASIYLTEVPLWDMTQILRDSEIARVLSGWKHGAVIPVLKSFLVRNTDKIILVQIDLRNLKAGHIRKDETGGSVTKNSWSQYQVFQIAHWCDLFLNESEKFSQLHQAIKKRALSVHDAWQELQKGKDNPLIPRQRVEDATEAFLRLAEERPNELLELEVKHKQLYESIDGFIATYHRHNRFQPLDVQTHFVASGWLDPGEMHPRYVQLSSWEHDPHSEPNCIRVNIERFGPEGWVGLHWLNRSNNWGDYPGIDLSKRGYTSITFWARGERGGEVVHFRAGGVAGPRKTYPDSFDAMTNRISLEREWKQYTIDLRRRDLSNVIGGFGWVVTQSSNPEGATLYLDDIYYVAAR